MQNSTITTKRRYSTNSKEVSAQIEAHILQCVLNDEGEFFTNIKDAAKHMQSEFNRVANYPYNLQRIPNEQARFSDYLNGLPFNFYFYYSDIKDFLNGLGINPESKEFEDEKSQKLYHYLIFKQLVKNR